MCSGTKRWHSHLQNKKTANYKITKNRSGFDSLHLDSHFEHTFPLNLLPCRPVRSLFRCSTYTYIQATTHLHKCKMASHVQHPKLPFSEFFSKFANIYVRQTGHATLDILADVITENIQTSAHPIGPDSVVHDTAAGPGIGAAAIITSVAKEQFPKEILVSDNVPMMVSAARDSLIGSTSASASASASASELPHVECKELDSQDLSSIPDNYFTHSINNFSIFTFSRPVDAIRESCRTLRPGGFAVVTCWRRFAPMFIVHAAQKKIRPDLPLMATPGPEFFEEGVLEKVVREGGFTETTLVEKVLVVADEDNIAGLTMLMSGPMMSKAREGYTDEDRARWAEAVGQSVKEEVDQFGGIRFEAYVLLAIK
ncbi:S-adenosyl-L-methionine-dependent methyltransferase [Poronia punctata]|nr:S-adenosyl-L-methionine-dependent methyltransferase [Poronia punctata]